MTKFKKLSSRILISAFALMMLTGCGKKKDEKTTAEATTAATTAVVTEATTEVATVASTTEAAKASKNDAEGKVADKSEMTEVEEVIDNNIHYSEQLMAISFFVTLLSYTKVAIKTNLLQLFCVKSDIF